MKNFPAGRSATSAVPARQILRCAQNDKEKFGLIAVCFCARFALSLQKITKPCWVSPHSRNTRTNSTTSRATTTRKRKRANSAVLNCGASGRKTPGANTARASISARSAKPGPRGARAKRRGAACASGRWRRGPCWCCCSSICSIRGWRMRSCAPARRLRRWKLRRRTGPNRATASTSRT